MTCSSDNLCPVTDYMTCWEQLKAMSDSYGGVDGQPGYFDYDDPRDYEEWCAWNDVEEDEGYYAPFPPDVAGQFLLLSGTAFEKNTDPVVVASVVCATQPVGAHVPGLPNLSGDIDEYAGFVC